MANEGLTYSSESLGDVVIVNMGGKLDTATSGEAETYLTNIMTEGGGNKLLLNFEELKFISSAGLRIVLATTKKLKGMGGDLKLCHLAPIVKEVFDISGFSMIIKVYDTQEEALSTF